jgi:hypothetical protein
VHTPIRIDEEQKERAEEQKEEVATEVSSEKKNMKIAECNEKQLQDNLEMINQINSSMKAFTRNNSLVGDEPDSSDSSVELDREEFLVEENVGLKKNVIVFLISLRFFLFFSFLIFDIAEKK